MPSHLWHASNPQAWDFRALLFMQVILLSQTTFMHTPLLYIRQLLIDASISMDLHQDAMHDIIEEHLGDFRRLVAKDPHIEHRIGLSIFRTELKPIFGPLSLDRIPDISTEDLRTGGDTALFDACWQQLDALETLLREAGSTETAQVDFYLITDGVDTASSTVRFADLRQRMEALQSTGRWKFHFYQADLDTIELNALLGFRRRLVETTDPRQLREQLVEFLTPGDPSDDLENTASARISD